MSNEEIKKYSTSILDELLEQYSPTEKPYIGIFIETYLSSGFQKDYNVSSNEHPDYATEIGSPELISSLLIPLVIEIVKQIILPKLKEKSQARKNINKLEEEIKQLLDKKIKKNKKIDSKKLAKEISKLALLEIEKNGDT